MNAGDRGTPRQTMTRRPPLSVVSGTKAGTSKRHGGNLTTPKGRATPRQADRRRLAAERRARTRRWELILLVAVAAVLLAVALLAGGGGGSGPTNGTPIRVHG